MLASFFIPGGAAQAGWTSYSPLATCDSPTDGPDVLADRHGVPDHLVAARLGQLHRHDHPTARAGLTWMRLPFFVWAQFVTAFLLLLAFPPLEAAGVMQLMDRVAGTSFFLPTVWWWAASCAERQRRRQPAAVAAPVLVPGAPGGVRADPAGDGHRGGDHRQQHPQAALGLQVAGLFGAVPRVHVVHRLGAPHVSDRHGHDDQRRSSRPRR